MAIRVCWGHMEPPFWGGRGGRRGSAMVPLEWAMAVSYRQSIVTVALSVTIRPQFAVECRRRSNQQGVGDFGPKFRGVPLGADPSCWCCKERTSQGNWRWNYLGRIPNYVITIHQRHRRTDRRTDGQTTCDRNTALCTKVHRAVKIPNNIIVKLKAGYGWHERCRRLFKYIADTKHDGLESGQNSCS